MGTDVIGFTLGELGILTAFVVVFAFAFETAKPTVPQTTADSLQAELNEAQTARDSFRARLAALRDSIGSGKPTCREKGLIDGYLFTATVVGERRFKIASDTLSFNGIRSIFSPELIRAERADCVHQVRVVSDRGISTRIYIDAFNLLGQLFYARAVE